MRHGSAGRSDTFTGAVMRSALLVGLPLAFLTLGQGPAEAAGGDVVLVSRSRSGTEGNFSSHASRMGSGGRYVAFQSQATNLGDGATNGSKQIHRKDTVTGDVVLASCNVAGQQAESDCGHPFMTPDGRYVVFQSSASWAGVPRDDQQIYRKDLSTGALILVSCDASGAEGDDYSQRPKISADGRYVVFGSEAVNLGADGSYKQILMKDLDTGAITLVSCSASGVAGDSNSGHPWITPDGLYVGFQSPSTNLHPAADGTNTQVFRKNVQTGAISLVSSTAAGVAADAKGRFAAVTSDGRYVTFQSQATNLDPAATGVSVQAFRKDLDTGAVTLVSCDASGVEGNAGVDSLNRCPVSDDGRYVAFLSRATNLDPTGRTGTTGYR